MPKIKKKKAELNSSLKTHVVEDTYELTFYYDLDSLLELFGKKTLGWLKKNCDNAYVYQNEKTNDISFYVNGHHVNTTNFSGGVYSVPQSHFSELIPLVLPTKPPKFSGVDKGSPDGDSTAIHTIYTDLKKSITSPVNLKDAFVFGQLVLATTEGSVYTYVAKYKEVNIAIRVTHNNEISIRVAPYVIYPEVRKFADMVGLSGITKVTATYNSCHVSSTGSLNTDRFILVIKGVFDDLGFKYHIPTVKQLQSTGV